MLSPITKRIISIINKHFCNAVIKHSLGCTELCSLVHFLIHCLICFQQNSSGAGFTSVHKKSEKLMTNWGLRNCQMACWNSDFGFLTSTSMSLHDLWSPGLEKAGLTEHVGDLLWVDGILAMGLLISYWGHRPTFVVFCIWSQRVGHDLVTEQQQLYWSIVVLISKIKLLYSFHPWKIHRKTIPKQLNVEKTVTSFLPPL